MAWLDKKLAPPSVNYTDRALKRGIVSCMASA
jgi:hypothetical protein